jgi:hypothetical protein
MNSEEFPKMTIAEALNILKPGKPTVEAIQTAYKKFMFEYHPDRNPNGLEMAKLGNAARDILMKSLEFLESIFEREQAKSEDMSDIPEEVEKILETFRRYPGLTLELCGVWVWVSGATKLYKDDLKKAGLKWAPKKLMWYFAPSDSPKKRHKPLDMEVIRAKYGSQYVEKEEGKAVNY